MHLCVGPVLSRPDTIQRVVSHIRPYLRARSSSGRKTWQGSGNETSYILFMLVYVSSVPTVIMVHDWAI